MDYNGDMIRIVEGRCGAIERGIVEIPFWRSELPNELGKIATVFVVAGSAVFRGKIVLVPPCELSLRRQRRHAGASDQITADRDKSLASLRPQRRYDVGRPRSPVKAGECRLLDLERVHQGESIESHCRLLTISKCFARKKAG